MSKSSASSVIQDGDYVIIKTEKHTFSIRVSRTGKACLWKKNIDLSPLIGDRFGCKYEIKNNSLNRINHVINTTSSKKGESDETFGKDNRNILDDGKSQKLSRTDIEALKSNGLTAQEIVDNIVENSATFQDKTDFSQEKYLNKKRRKYDYVFTVCRPSIRLVTETYHLSNPQKILRLRIDSLSQMLTAANILSGGKYLTLDSCFGLVTAAVMQRLGNQGHVVQLHAGDHPPRHAIDMMNFNEENKSVLTGLPISKLHDEEDEVQEPPSKRAKVDDDNEKEMAKREKRERRAAEWRTSKRLIREKNFDGLLIACKYNPNDCIDELGDLVGISRPIVVFCAYVEPLVECFKRLRKTSNYVNLQLSDTWLRNYQVLPNRSHPEINMSGSGGYLLTGTKVDSSR